VVDGADQGVKPTRALETILGNSGQPAEEEKMDPVEFEQWILAAPDRPATYDDAARAAAKHVLTFFRAFPQYATAPADAEGALNANDEFVMVKPGVYNLMEEYMPETFKRLERLELTGFMWGYAVNAARRCCELPPTNNPAILTLG